MRELISLRNLRRGGNGRVSMPNPSRMYLVILLIAALALMLAGFSLRQNWTGEVYFKVSPIPPSIELRI